MLTSNVVAGAAGYSALLRAHAKAITMEVVRTVHDGDILSDNPQFWSPYQDMKSAPDLEFFVSDNLEYFFRITVSRSDGVRVFKVAEEPDDDAKYEENEVVDGKVFILDEWFEMVPCNAWSADEVEGFFYGVQTQELDADNKWVTTVGQRAFFGHAVLLQLKEKNAYVGIHHDVVPFTTSEPIVGLRSFVGHSCVVSPVVFTEAHAANMYDAGCDGKWVLRSSIDEKAEDFYEWSIAINDAVDA